MLRFRPFEENTETILIYAKADHNFDEAERIFNERFPDNPIYRKYLRERVGKFQRTRSEAGLKRAGKNLFRKSNR